MAAPHRKPARLLSELGATRAAVRRRLRPAAVPAAMEDHHRLLVANLPDAIISLYDRDLVGVVVEGPMLKREGYTSEDFVGRRLVDSLGSADLAVFEPLFRAALDGRRGMIEYLSPRSQVLYEMEIVPQVSASGSVVGAFSVARDVTAARQAHRAADQVVASFEAIFNAAPIGVLILSSEGLVELVNPGMTSLAGYDVAELQGTAFARLIHPEDVPKLERELAALAAGEVGQGQVALRCAHGSGHTISVEAHITALGDAPVGRRILVQIVDTTETQRSKDRLLEMAETDPLTGLANRRRFNAELDRHVAHVERYGPEGSAIVIDIDSFKDVNDTLGHIVGDQVITSVASVLRSRLRRTDVLARVGGDEFAILLPKGSREQTAAIADELVTAVRGDASLPGGRGAKPITVSMGLAMFDESTGLTSETVIADADLAMYEAKENGGDGYSFFASGVTSAPRIKARIEWVDRIATALESGRFVLLVQPIVDLQGGHVTQYELLLRMRDDEGGLIAPAAFLSVAERYGMISRIDRWVVERAVEILDTHERAGHPIRLEVNLSGKTVGDPDAVQAIEQAVRSADIDAENLIFEITETAAISDIENASRFARRMRSLGCRFALDDFGAGYGSFYYLKHLPFDYLKIDGEFIIKSLSDRTDQIVIRSIVQIAQGLHKKTIAEFVPDSPTQLLLRRMGVDYGQGYHVGRPEPLPSLDGARPS